VAYANPPRVLCTEIPALDVGSVCQSNQNKRRAIAKPENES